MDATSTTELIEGINNAWVSNINNSTEFWWYLAGVVGGLFALGLLNAGFRSLFSSIFRHGK